jgi:BON domain
MAANRRNRIVIEASGPRHQFKSAKPRPRESVVAVTVIVAATLATFVALFITSRPYDPMNSTVEPQQTVPPSQALMTPSPRPSPTTSPSPQSAVSGQATESASETAKPIVVDDATIQAEIEKALTADPALAKLDVSTLVENGRVTLAGSVKSLELKQRVEKTVRGIKGVLSVDNQLAVTEATP